MKSIAIDMDNVIADVASHYINWYERDYGKKLRKEDLAGVPELKAFPEEDAVLKFLNTPGFFSTAPVIKGSREALLFLNEKFDIYIVSAAMEFPHSLNEKFHWLKANFPFISWKKIVFCGNKGVVDTDFMIDDHLKNLDSCKGEGILYSAFHNVNIDYPRRVNNWEEATAYLNSKI